ncbi:conserved unknown protein [Ectocarpus siliculosus]|uniref:PGAP2IP C-terminal nuclease-like domain-containing protein n=1 Tax=Ectocarpus siliculosus TaxID=2880 RepID=D7FZJ1_ECTSI|nr:conserved unknown protein [Ectocarpus siliculosus]|eukprot:CBJ32798.1 conserved unknown protein [Ectocarpus siliculosus]
MSFIFVPKSTGQRTVRVVNFNVYMGYDRRGEDNTFRVGRLLKDLEADIAGLQETGLMRLTLGNRHYAGAVARAAGMVLAAAAPVAEDTWGCAILSRLPVLSWGWRRLPRGPGENACVVHATLSLGGGMGVATVVNVHLGNEGDTEKQVVKNVFVQYLLGLPCIVGRYRKTGG